MAFENTVRCRYNTIQYDMILYTTLPCLTLNIDESLNRRPLNPYKKPHIAKGCLSWRFWKEIWPRYNGTAPYFLQDAGQYVQASMCCIFINQCNILHKHIDMLPLQKYWVWIFHQSLRGAIKRRMADARWRSFFQIQFQIHKKKQYEFELKWQSPCLWSVFYTLK